MSEIDLHAELAALTAGLRAHLEASIATGTTGLPAASPALAQSRIDAAPGPGHGTRDAPAGASPGPPSPLSRTPSAAGGGSGTERLVVLASEVATCTRCRLHAERKQAVFARGTGASGICFVGEGPGAEEDARGEPFVGKAGELLDRMVSAMGLDRDAVYVCNIVKCRPPKNRKPEPDEMAACRPFLTAQMEALAPRVIVALGATAVEGLLGLSGGITRLRGTWRLYQGTIPVMPTFHPAYLLRTPEAKRDVWNDLQLVLQHLGLPVPARK